MTNKSDDSTEHVDDPLNTRRRSVLLDMPVDVRSVSLAVLAILAGLFAMQWAREVLVPILFGVMMSYALTPIVNKLQRLRIPRPVGAGIIVTGIAGAIAWGAWTLSPEVDALADRLPRVAQQIRQLTEGKRGAVSTLEKVQQAAAALESSTGSAPVDRTSKSTSGRATDAAAPRSSSPPRAPSAAQTGTTDNVAGRSGLDIRSYLLSGTIGALAFLGKTAVVFFVALFLMASGNNFRRKMVKLAGPKLSQKKVTIETLDEITEQVQRYMLVQVGISIVVGIATWLAFVAIGLDQPAVWGVVAGLTNLIPYVGAVIVGGASAVAGLVQFGSAEMGLIVGGSSFVIHALIGNVLTPWWMGRASKMSPVAVFVAVLVFGWVWGVAGLLLGVPILMVVKSVCDRIDDLKPVGELLGA